SRCVNIPKGARFASAVVATSQPPASSTSCGGAKMGEQIRHLERAADGLRARADTRLRLVETIEREDAERNGYAGLERGELETARSLARDVLEVRRVTSDVAAERDDAREAARCRERGRRERELEGARNDHDRDRVLTYPRRRELRERSVEQLGRDARVEPRHDPAHRAPASLHDAPE